MSNFEFNNAPPQMSKDGVEMLKNLTLFTQAIPKEQYECLILMSVYLLYAIQNNIKYIVANFKAFTTTCYFFECLRTSLEIRLTKTQLQQMLISSSPSTVSLLQNDDFIAQCMLPDDGLDGVVAKRMKKKYHLSG